MVQKKEDINVKTSEQQVKLIMSKVKGIQVEK